MISHWSKSEKTVTSKYSASIVDLFNLKKCHAISQVNFQGYRFIQRADTPINFLLRFVLVCIINASCLRFFLKSNDSVKYQS